MSQYKGLKTDDNDIDDNTVQRSRRLSLQITDLPVTTYWNRWCGDCCKKKYATTPLLDDEDESNKSLKTGKSPSKKDKKAKDTLIGEQCVDATVNKIVNNLSWINATLLALSLKNTLSKYIIFSNVGEKYGKANNAWIYFFIIFIIGILLAVSFRVFEDLDEMKRELDLKKKENKIIEGDREEVEKLEKKIESKKEENLQFETGAKIYNFVEVGAGDLFEKFEDLFVATLSNTVSMAWRDAAKATFFLIMSSASATATAYFFYAIFMTTFGIYLVIRIGGVYKKKEREIIKYLDEFDDRINTLKEEKQRLLGFAFTKRSIKLTQSFVKYAIAWSWRDCINSFIHAVYGVSNDDDVVAQQWGYFVTIALFVSFVFSFSEHFHILYPKNASKEEEKIFLADTSRLQVNDVLYDNFRFVVGMALFDALMISLQSLGDKDEGISQGVQCFLYWIVAIGGISLSIVGTYYVSKWGLRKKIANKGVAQAMFDTFERFYDPECELHIEGDADFIPMIFDTMVFESIYVKYIGCIIWSIY